MCEAYAGWIGGVAVPAGSELDEEMATIRKEITAAQRLNEMKNNMVANITENMQSLYFFIDNDVFEGLNSRFIKLCDEGKYQNLKLFNEEIIRLKNQISKKTEV